MREVDGEVGERPDGVEGGKVDGAESVVGDVERLQPVDVLEGLVLQLLDLQNNRGVWHVLIMLCCATART